MSIPSLLKRHSRKPSKHILDEELFLKENFSSDDIAKIADYKNSKGQFLVDTFSSAYLITRLTEETFDKLQRIFRKKEKENRSYQVTLTDFVWNFLVIIDSQTPAEEIYLVSALMSLYGSIRDANQNQPIRWEQITNVIIDILLDSDPLLGKNPVKTESDLVKYEHQTKVIKKLELVSALTYKANN